MKEYIIEKSLIVIGILIVGITVLGALSMQLKDNPLPIGDAVVLSGSMEPTLSVNDIVFFSKMKEYKAGDIVVFRDDGMTSVHRIVKKSKDEIVTKGDFNNALDPPITADKILGKVILSIPLIGGILEEKMILLIALAVLLLGLLRKRGAYE
ncbi:MAG: signal peptidase I [Clostridia bacterium]|nr:signal peptidase I [Clostridia bacterium]